jgi:hypothetical protein
MIYNKKSFYLLQLYRKKNCNVELLIDRGLYRTREMAVGLSNAEESEGG